MSKDKKKPDTRPAAGAETSAEEAADLDAVMRKYDRESATRPYASKRTNYKNPH